jgi:hypothetical protein
VAERYFTPAEVDRLIPTLTAVMEDMMDAHRGAAAIRERLEAEQQRIALAGGGLVDRGAWRADRARLEALTGRVRAGLERIGALGGVTKDLGLGLVDFLHLRDGCAVNLCWKYPEPAVRHWHGLDEGYAGRKPL